VTLQDLKADRISSVKSPYGQQQMSQHRRIQLVQNLLEAIGILNSKLDK